MSKRTTRYSKENGLIANDLNLLNSETFERIEIFKSPKSYKEAANLIIKTIHGVPRLFKKYSLSLGDISIYLGRTTEGSIEGNAKSKRAKGYDLYIPIFWADESIISMWEKWSIYLLDKIMNNPGEVDGSGLCVANMSISGQGAFGSGDHLIYIAVKIHKRTEDVYNLSNITRERIAFMMADYTGYQINEEEVRESLINVNRTSAFVPLSWAKGHGPNSELENNYNY